MITAVVLAAGLSTRMGQPKMMLKWGNKTVIQQVVDTLFESSIIDVIVVSGEWYKEISSLVTAEGVKVIVNPLFANGEMTASLQTGISNMPEASTHALVVLGDQPFLNPDTISKLIAASQISNKKIIMPSINDRRGHPWLIERSIWVEVMALKPPLTMRDFFNIYQTEIEYVVVNDENIIQDMDTPEDYRHLKPKDTDE
jgi:molybdenum cofactor cytidylyltransferase